jgi:hypothetical protein
MDVVKFPCSGCQKLMAVGPDLLGHHVRCPHCQQVIVAPAAESAAEPTDGGDPFSFGGVVDSPVMAAEEASVEPTPSEPPHVAKPPAARNSWLLPILVPYAAFMTIMAIVYFVKYASAVQEHPLEYIPDLLGEYQQKQTKGKPQARNLTLPPADQDLPSRLTTSLGRPIRIGDIEVTPLSVEYRPWVGYTKPRGRPQPKKVPIKDTLVLHLRLRNVSKDLTFYPTDPYFDRDPKSSNDKPYTLVDVAGRKFYGGLIDYQTEANDTERTWLQGREDDDKPLGPGESRETVLVTRPRDAVFDAVKKSQSPAVWRVQVRRGLVLYHDTEIPVSAVIGVSFTAADVKASPSLPAPLPQSRERGA